MKAGNREIFGGLVFALCGTMYLSAQNSAPIQPKVIKHDKQTPASAHPESFEQLAARAQVAMSAEHVPEAIRLYGRATKLRPNWSEGWWHLGTLLFDTGRFGEARDAFAQFVTVEQKQPGPGFAMLGLTEF